MQGEGKWRRGVVKERRELKNDTQKSPRSPLSTSTCRPSHQVRGRHDTLVKCLTDIMNSFLYRSHIVQSLLLAIFFISLSHCSIYYLWFFLYFFPHYDFSYLWFLSFFYIIPFLLLMIFPFFLFTLYNLYYFRFFFPLLSHITQTLLLPIFPLLFPIVPFLFLTINFSFTFSYRSVTRLRRPLECLATTPWTRVRILPRAVGFHLSSAGGWWMVTWRSW